MVESRNSSVDPGFCKKIPFISNGVKGKSPQYGEDKGVLENSKILGDVVCYLATGEVHTLMNC